METPSLVDRITLNSREYLLKTVDDAAAKRILLRYFNAGGVAYSSEIKYQDDLVGEERQQLAAEFHQRHKVELERLVLLHRGNGVSYAEPQVRYLLAHGFLKYGMYEETIANLQIVLATERENPLIRSILGKVYLMKSDYRLALEQFEYAISHHEQYADLHFNAGVCLYHLGNCFDALKSFSHTLKINPYLGEAHFFAALTLLLNVKLAQEYKLTKRMPERLKELLAHAGEILPTIRTAVFEQGRGLITEGKYEEALEVLAPLSLMLEHDKAAWFNYEFYLNVLLKIEQISPQQVWQEVAKLEDFVQRHPHYADLHYDLGFAYAVLGVSFHVKSLVCLNKALSINPAYQRAQWARKHLENEARSLNALVHAMSPLNARRENKKS